MAKLEDMIKKQPISDTLIDRMNDAIDDHLESDLIPAINDYGEILSENGYSINEDESLQLIIPDYFLTDPEIVGYGDEEFQYAIYRWALSTCNYAGASVKDLGCGRGDFKGTIDAELWPNNTNKYIGVDFNPLMVDAARKKYEGIDVRHGDWSTLTDQTDYTFCIGSLNDDNGQDKWEVFTKTLFHAFGNTKQQIIFIFNVGESAEGSFSFELDKLMTVLPSGYPFQIDCSRFEGICKLIVYCKKFE